VSQPGDPIERPSRFSRTGDPVSLIEAKLTSAVERLGSSKPGDILGIAASQIDLIRSYYDLALYQARRSFRWALVAAGIGLAFFLASVIFLLLQRPQQVAAVSLISGALIEVIAAINFYLYNKTSIQLADFLTRLDLTQRFLLSSSMCESLEGEFKQKARFSLIEIIAGLKNIEAGREPNEPAK
jgi:hypothetical protein